MLEPTPGYVALKLAPLGHELALSLLGCAVLYNVQSTDPNAFYTALGGAASPLHEIRSVYETAGDTHPYLLPACGPLLDWAQSASPHLEVKVRQAAAILADIDFNAFAESCADDILGEVHSELIAFAARRRYPVRYTDIVRAAITTFGRSPVVKPGEGICDTACGTGRRVHAYYMYARACDIDPETLSWYLADYDPMALALAAVSIAPLGLGDDVHLVVGEYPVHVNNTWPDANITRWVTDSIETHARIHGMTHNDWGMDDPERRDRAGLYMAGDPVLSKIYPIAHGLFDDVGDDVYEEAVRFVRDADALPRWINDNYFRARSAALDEIYEGIDDAFQAAEEAAGMELMRITERIDLPVDAGFAMRAYHHQQRAKAAAEGLF